MKTDPVTLQIIGSSLLYASEEMGMALRNSAYSPNIKERMDHSAAVFDSRGRLLAQAEHIPVHLGSLPWGLKNLIRRLESEGGSMEEGSMVVANDPYVTGTHLNDVTVAAPVYEKGELIAYAVNKAHHADVGGQVPGSISMGARSLSEEGLVLEPTVIWKNGGFAVPRLEAFSSASRTPTERRGDLKAQVAANLTGVRRIKEIIAKYGLDDFISASIDSFAHSDALVKKRLSRFRPGEYASVDYLEGPEGEDLVLKVRATISESGVTFDYSGTSPQVDYPLNAVLGVTISGAHFVLRCLLGDDIAANHGAFARIRVKAPRGSLLNPTSPHPVGGGNVETSQRNADVLFRALAASARGRVPAAAGGSMNNVMVGGTTGGSSWAFYETIGVGLGGRRGMDGVDGIQGNMTNTMNTPIEEIERILPVRMVAYEFRQDSSGAGRFRGGSGLVRAYRSLADGVIFTVLADRGRHRPWGLAGGQPGMETEVFLIRGGSTTPLPLKATFNLDLGDVVEVRTAGGGGYGTPLRRPKSMVEKDLEEGYITRARAESDYRRSRSS